MTCKRGDIVQVPFPFSDLSAMKKRPVMVLTDADAYGDFLAVGVTSRSHHSDSIPLTRIDLTSGALPMDSWVRIDRVITLNCRLPINVENLWTDDLGFRHSSLGCRMRSCKKIRYEIVGRSFGQKQSHIE